MIGSEEWWATLVGTIIGVAVGTVPAVWIAFWQQKKVRQQREADRRAQLVNSAGRSLLAAVKANHQRDQAHRPLVSLVPEPAGSPEFERAIDELVLAREFAAGLNFAFEVLWRENAEAWKATHARLATFAWPPDVDDSRMSDAIDFALDRILEEERLRTIAEFWVNWDGHGTLDLDAGLDRDEVLEETEYTMYMWLPEEEHDSAADWWKRYRTAQLDRLLRFALYSDREEDFPHEEFFGSNYPLDKWGYLPAPGSFVERFTPSTYERLHRRKE